MFPRTKLNGTESLDDNHSEDFFFPGHHPMELEAKDPQRVTPKPVSEATDYCTWQRPGAKRTWL